MTLSKLYGNLSPEISQRFKQVSLLICDVDGVFSDGRIYLGNDGEELKAFHTRDGFGVKALISSGVPVAVITGRSSHIVESRMISLTVPYIFQGVENKTVALNKLAAKTGIPLHDMAYIGDDMPDYDVMNQCGLAIAVKDAHPFIVETAHYVTHLPGGFGAVREVCDLIMHCKGTLHLAKGASI